MASTLRSNFFKSSREVSIHKFMVSAITNVGRSICSKARNCTAGAAFAKNTYLAARHSLGILGSKVSSTFSCVSSVTRVFQSTS